MYNVWNEMPESIFQIIRGQLGTQFIRPATSLGHQEGRRVFWEGGQIFLTMPNTFCQGVKIF